MRIVIVGGGPGGLYFAYLVKKHCPSFEVRLYEQMHADATHGFGVVPADGSLQQRKRVDAESATRIIDALHWNPLQCFEHGNDSVWIDKKRPGGAVGLAHDFVMRTGRITAPRLETEFPRLMQRLHERQARETPAVVR